MHREPDRDDNDEVTRERHNGFVFAKSSCRCNAPLGLEISIHHIYEETLASEELVVTTRCLVQTEGRS